MNWSGSYQANTAQICEYHGKVCITDFNPVLSYEFDMTQTDTL